MPGYTTYLKCRKIYLCPLEETDFLKKELCADSFLLENREMSIKIRFFMFQSSHEMANKMTAHAFVE